MRTCIRHALVLTTVALAAALGCGGEDDDESPASAAPAERSERSEGSEASVPAPPPDAGTRTGHAGDRPGRVEVPESDESPPEATVLLRSAGGRTLARVAGRGEGQESAVTLSAPELRGTTVGTDGDGGVARVRVSIREELRCGSRIRLRTRYFPPPQVERIRSTPGALLPTRKTRSVPIELSLTRCGETPEQIRGELWGEAINGSGLEAVTSHIPFTWSP